MGPAVKLLAQDNEGLSAEDQEAVDRIAATISAMARDGIRLQYCLFAASVQGVDPESVLPEINPVGNGWISLIGYQAKGYSLVPIY